MLVYLLKSAACMALLLLFYKVLLEKENMHVFKRFYLLAALVASLLIPNLVFIEYVEPTVVTYSSIETAKETPLGNPIYEPRDINVINWNLIVWTIYSLGLIGFGFRFFGNLLQIINRIRKNPKLKQKFSIKVLLQKQLPPHTFFKYVFLNKAKFEANEIPKEVVLHEEVHARQRHSIDVVFIELLQVILWFNPLIYFFKKCIKLNHEFLADSAVLKKHISTANYQNTLLSYLSRDYSKENQSINMANAINYSSIKKRFKIMKTETSKKAVLLRSILVLPLFALLLFAFSTKKEIIQPTSDKSFINYDHTARSVEITILKDGTYLVEGIEANKDNLVEIVNTLHKDITSETRKEIMNIHLESSEEVTREEVWFFYNSLMNYGFHRLVTDDQVVNISKGNKPLAIETKRSITNSFEKKNIQESASRKLMAEYNALAKKYNEMDSNRMRILKEDVERLEYIYSLMSDKQKADAEPFPDFPEPPPAPKALNGTAAISTPPAPPKVLKGKASDIPSPPEPLAPIDHVIEMAKRGATFYNEGKEISSDKAIELLKNNESLNISTTKSGSKNPQVRISKSPIRIKKSSASKINLETGNITVNGNELFYSTKNGITSYFNAKGEQVDHQGKKIEGQSTKNPTFYFNSNKISSVKAHQLLKNNKSIQVATEDYSKDEYAIVLTDLSKVTHNQNLNKNDNPNSVIDLTEMIAKEASFFYNNEPISTEKALWLTKNTNIERVNNKGSKNGKPKVYLWKKV